MGYKLTDRINHVIDEFNHSRYEQKMNKTHPFIPSIFSEKIDSFYLDGIFALRVFSKSAMSRQMMTKCFAFTKQNFVFPCYQIKFWKNKM